MRRFFRQLKIINDRLSITIVTYHALGKTALILRIKLVKPLQYEFRMQLVLGKYDSLANAFATGHLYAALH